MSSASSSATGNPFFNCDIDPLTGEKYNIVTSENIKIGMRVKPNFEVGV